MVLRVRSTLWMTLLRASALIALATSVAMAVDYYGGPVAAYCAQQGCAAVRRSVSLGGTNPLPYLGIAAFGLLFLLSLPSSASLRLRLVVPLAAVGGLLGATLLATQPLVIHAWCPPCLIVDTAAVLAGVSALAWARAVRSVAASPTAVSAVATAELMRRWAWLTLLSLSVAAPLLWPTVRPRPSLPPGIAALGVPDKLTVVEFSDFECPFCRELHPRLMTLLDAYGDRVKYVELNAPLPSHPHAHEAARAAVCADAQGRGRQMADELFRAPLLSSATYRDLAAQQGLELTRFDRCLADAGTERRVQVERGLLQAAGLEGLPTVFIGTTKLVGAQSTEMLRKELDRALRPQGSPHLPAPLFAGLLGLVVATVIALGHPRRRGPLVPTASGTPVS